MKTLQNRTNSTESEKNLLKFFYFHYKTKKGEVFSGWGGGGSEFCASFQWVVGVLMNNFYMQDLYLWLPIFRRNLSFPAICQAHSQKVPIFKQHYFCGRVLCT